MEGLQNHLQGPRAAVTGSGLNPFETLRRRLSERPLLFLAHGKLVCRWKSTSTNRQNNLHQELHENLGLCLGSTYLTNNQVPQTGGTDRRARDQVSREGAAGGPAALPLALPPLTRPLPARKDNHSLTQSRSEAGPPGSPLRTWNLNRKPTAESCFVFSA